MTAALYHIEREKDIVDIGLISGIIGGDDLGCCCLDKYDMGRQNDAGPAYAESMNFEALITRIH